MRLIKKYHKDSTGGMGTGAKKIKSPKHAKIMFLGSTRVATFLFDKMS